MSHLKHSRRSSVSRFLLPAALAVGLGLGALSPRPANAQVTALSTEMAKLSGIVDGVAPIAIGASVLGFGMLLVKRVVYS